MKLVRLALFGLQIFGLYLVWNRLGWVEAAYTEEPESIAFSTEGIDLTFEPTDLGPSPYIVADRAASDELELSQLVAGSKEEPRVFGGNSALSGTVYGPLGVLEGATVVIERHTNAGVSTEQVVTGVDGHWELSGVLGGRYRIRSFVPFEFAQGPAQVIILPAGERKDLSTVLSEFVSKQNLELVGGREINPGQELTVAVVVSATQLAADGTTVTAPVGAVSVEMSVSGPFTLLSESVAETDGGGAARFLLRCDGPGAPTVRATVDGVARSFSIPGCVEPPAPEPEPVAPTVPIDGGDQ